MLAVSPVATKKSAFTLIEVLVVVAIIALLIAILLPSLKRARNEAQAAACAANMRQCVNGIVLQQAENAMRREQWSTNFGWATYSLKQNNGQTGIFTCPADRKPRPVAAALDRMYDSALNPRGTSSGDAIFSRVRHVGINGGAGSSADTWQTDIQDQMDGDVFGGDAAIDAQGDFVLQYQAPPGKHMVSATYAGGARSWKHNLFDYKGKVIYSEYPNSFGTFPVALPILWMSYGANSYAGLKNVKGTPILLVEAGKLGIFPEKLGSYPQDHLGWALRFRHGGTAGSRAMEGRDYTKVFPVPPRSEHIDKAYAPEIQLNAAFIDGHVERLGHWQLFKPQADTWFNPTPVQVPWFGLSKPKTPLSF